MSYKCEKMELVNDIVKLLGTTKDLEVLIDIKDILKKEPIHISEFIRDLFNKNYHQDIYKTDDILNAFEHEVRHLCCLLKYDKNSEKTFKKINADNQYIDHWCELYVNKLELDLWISENSESPFDPKELAWVIYNIYIGKVVFNK